MYGRSSSVATADCRLLLMVYPSFASSVVSLVVTGTVIGWHYRGAASPQLLERFHRSCPYVVSGFRRTVSGPPEGGHAYR